MEEAAVQQRLRRQRLRDGDSGGQPGGGGDPRDLGWGNILAWPGRMGGLTPLCPPLPDEEGDSSPDPWVPDAAERAMLREEFTSRMYQRFLDGEDGDFDYR